LKDGGSQSGDSAQGTRAHRGRRYKRRSRYGPREGSSGAEDPSIVRKYFPVFENLILFILDSRNYLRSLGAYAREEFNTRGRSFILGAVFLVAALTFLVGVVLFLTAGLFFLARDFTGSNTAGAFLVSGGTLILTIITMSAALFFFRGITRPPERLNEYGEEEDLD